MPKFVSAEEDNKLHKVPDDDRLEEVPEPPEDATVRGGNVKYVHEKRGNDSEPDFYPEKTLEERLDEILSKNPKKEEIIEAFETFIGEEGT